CSLTSPRSFYAVLSTGTTIDAQLCRDINNNGFIDNGEFVTSTVDQGGNRMLADLPAGNYFMHVDAYSGGVGKYNLTVEAPFDGAGATLATAKNLGTVDGLFSGTGLDIY